MFSKTRYIREHLEALGIDPLIVSKYKKLKNENKNQKDILNEIYEYVNGEIKYWNNYSQDFTLTDIQYSVLQTHKKYLSIIENTK